MWTFLRVIAVLGLFYLRVRTDLSALFRSFLLKTVNIPPYFLPSPAGFNGKGQKVVIRTESQETDGNVKKVRFRPDYREVGTVQNCLFRSKTDEK